MSSTALTAMAVRKLKPATESDRPELKDPLVKGFGVRCNSAKSPAGLNPSGLS